jgi:hypothetical protein
MSPTSADITIKIQSLSGEACYINTSLEATLADVKAEIHTQLGHSLCSQRLLLGQTPLRDSSMVLHDVGISAASILTLVVVQEPMGQSSLVKPEGAKMSIIPPGCLNEYPFPKEMLNKFELKSWQAVCEAHKLHDDILFQDWNEEYRPESDGVDLFWTTRSDGCRYEYWSSGAGGNEYGVLVRVDAKTMTAIGFGSDDGLEIFEDINTNYINCDAVKELIREGWPRPKCWKEESDDDNEESDDDDDSEESDNDDDDHVNRISSDLPLQVPTELGGTSLEDGSPLRRALRHGGC